MVPSIRTDTGLLVLRLVVGVTFLMHGVDKLGDLGGVEQGFAGMGIPAPEIMAPLVAMTETVGGILLITGFLTPFAGVALAVTMLVAAISAHTGKGFFASDGGYEYTLVLGAATLMLAIIGAGRFSLDAFTLRGKDRPSWVRGMRTIAQQ